MRIEYKTTSIENKIIMFIVFLDSIIIYELKKSTSTCIYDMHEAKIFYIKIFTFSNKIIEMYKYKVINKISHIFNT